MWPTLPFPHATSNTPTTRIDHPSDFLLVVTVFSSSAFQQFTKAHSARYRALSGDRKALSRECGVEVISVVVIAVRSSSPRLERWKIRASAQGSASFASFVASLVALPNWRGQHSIEDRNPTC